MTRDAAEDNTEEAKECRNLRRRRRLNGVAALLVTDIALRQSRSSGRSGHCDGLRGGRRCRGGAPRFGDRKKREERKAGNVGEQHCL